MPFCIARASAHPIHLQRQLFLVAMLCSTLLTFAQRPALAQSISESGSEAGARPLASETDNAETDAPAPLQMVAPKTLEMLIGVKVTSGSGNMLSTLATTVFPTPWPEQTVEILQVNMPANFRHDFRELPGGNQQLLMFAPVIPGNSTVEGTIRVRIQKSHIVGPEETTEFVIPRRIRRDLGLYIKDSPFIESSISEIRKIVKEIEASEPLTDWKKIEMMYDWVRENIAYERGDLKTVREALRDGTGDCEEMTSTFVALCRAARVPARCVWLPNHCYPEFYLEDKEGQGYWFPCQVAGTRNFGSMPEYLPILQKGDRFKVPEQTEVQRYLADYLSSKKVLGKGTPRVEFVRQLLGDAAAIPAPDLNGAANRSEEAAP
ncbi:transglutaminase-like domain-containing protein [Aureliella helgolandensis]|uniref:Transglutaminase-like superfamily protein n=1 Tax=Aureliella helgolandensis TaxID=2527968 RepID=A0A518G0B1_9BACT|nr:transglutaminase-like domain-containing protein [Aureliella helgolandensis]QDV22042.1 Transglutaminase-like superfamily protein [Aureliella helgolandensis]